MNTAAPLFDTLVLAVRPDAYAIIMYAVGHTRGVAAAAWTTLGVAASLTILLALINLTPATIWLNTQVGTVHVGVQIFRLLDVGMILFLIGCAISLLSRHGLLASAASNPPRHANTYLGMGALLALLNVKYASIIAPAAVIGLSTDAAVGNAAAIVTLGLIGIAARCGGGMTVAAIGRAVPHGLRNSMPPILAGIVMLTAMHRITVMW